MQRRIDRQLVSCSRLISPAGSSACLLIWHDNAQDVTARQKFIHFLVPTPGESCKGNDVWRLRARTLSIFTWSTSQRLSFVSFSPAGSSLHFLCSRQRTSRENHTAAVAEFNRESRKKSSCNVETLTMERLLIEYKDELEIYFLVSFAVFWLIRLFVTFLPSGFSVSVFLWKVNKFMKRARGLATPMKGSSSRPAKEKSLSKDSIMKSQTSVSLWSYLPSVSSSSCHLPNEWAVGCKQENHWKVIDNIFCITNEISFTIISLSSSDKFFLESWFSSWNYYFLTNYHWNLLRFTLYIRS